MNTTATPEASVQDDSPGLNCLPVKEIARLYGQAGFSEAALRNLIARAEANADHPELGGAAAGFLEVIVRPPGQRKVLLDRVAFDRWLASGRHRRIRADASSARSPRSFVRRPRRF
jgi:hypothetical protein